MGLEQALLTLPPTHHRDWPCRDTPWQSWYDHDPSPCIAFGRSCWLRQQGGAWVGLPKHICAGLLQVPPVVRGAQPQG